MISSLAIGELFEFRKGKKPSELFDSCPEDGKPFLQIDHLRGKGKEIYVENTNGTEVDLTDVCVVWDGANAGLVGYGLKGFIGSTITRLRPKKVRGLHIPYIAKFLQSKFTYLNAGTQGAAIPHVDGSNLKKLKIPLPPLEEQKRIAAILDKADALRRKRQQAIDLTDKLLRSVFLEMFGDPVTNPKGWGLVCFGDVGQLDRGKSKHRPRNAPFLLGGDHPLIQTGDVANSGGYITTYKSTYSDAGLKQSKKWPKGILCITIAANIANTGILEFEACFPDSVVGFKPNELVTVEYVQAWLGFLQKIIEDAAPESAQKNINLAILRDLKIPLPNIEIQKTYSEIVNQVKDTKDRLVNGEVETHNLFLSLTKQAFRGELTKQSEAA